MVLTPFQQIAEVAPLDGAARGVGSGSGDWNDFSKSERFWGLEFGKSAVKLSEEGKGRSNWLKNVKKHLFVWRATRAC